MQGELEMALQSLYRSPVRVTGASRTDAGVHAAGQVVHFDPPLAIPPHGVARALAGLLPEDVRVLRAWVAPAHFDARRSARAKRYCYRLAWGPPLPPWDALRRFWLPNALDAAVIAKAIGALSGTHDFAAFALTGHSGHGARGTFRTITRATLRGRGRRADLVFEGDGFLRGMVRRIAGALIEVGRGAQTPSWFHALLTHSTGEPPAPTAPAHGLTLERVFY